MASYSSATQFGTETHAGDALDTELPLRARVSTIRAARQEEPETRHASLGRLVWCDLGLQSSPRVRRWQPRPSGFSPRCSYSYLSGWQRKTKGPGFEVNYLAKEPTIDGKLDSDLSYLPVRNFQVREKSNPQNPDTAVNYRIAYNEQYFYLYVEMNSPTYICRDRGYQNGDAFSLVLGRPLLRICEV